MARALRIDYADAYYHMSFLVCYFLNSKLT